MLLAAKDCDGIVHLAGVTRVVWGYKDPKKCWQHNVFGLNNIIKAANSFKKKPWVLFASSREVYGQQIHFPVRENHCELMPINIYAKSKLAAENLFLDARESGLLTGVVRLSSVYGDLLDHKTRVVPAYVQAAAHRSPLIIEGREEHYCDLTHVSDLADALYRFIKKLDAGEALPPIHLTSGIATSLVKLANMAIDL